MVWENQQGLKITTTFGIALQIPPIKSRSESMKRMSKVSLKQLKTMKPWISTWNIPPLRNDSKRRVSFTFQNFQKLFVNGKLTCSDCEQRYSGSTYKPFLKYTLKTGRILHALFHSIKGHTRVKLKIYERRVKLFYRKANHPIWQSMSSIYLAFMFSLNCIPQKRFESEA